MIISLEIFLNRWLFAWRHCKKQMLVGLFVTFGALWSLIDPFVTLGAFTFPNWSVWVMVAISAFAAMFYHLPRAKGTIRLKFCNSKITVLFGNLLGERGHKVISVNEFFDDRLGEHVSPESLHGKLIAEVFASNSDAFRRAIDEALQNRPHEVVQRPSGNKQRYPIGTTAAISVGGIKYFCCAVSKTNVNSLKASATPEELNHALKELWSVVREKADGARVNIPLIGGGLARTGIPAIGLVNTIILAFYLESKREQVIPELLIVIPPEYAKELDIGSLVKQWE